MLGSNPILEYFPDLVPTDGLFAAKDVMLLWNKDDRGDGTFNVRDFTVVFYPETIRRQFEAWKSLTSEQRRGILAFDDWQHQFDCSSGNCCNDWLVAWPRSSPWEVFEDLRKRGQLMDHAEVVRAIQQLALIRECDLARNLAKAFRS